MKANEAPAPRRPPDSFLRPQRLAGCPARAEEIVEAYCLGRLPAWRSRNLESHCLLCPECALLMESTQEFLDTFRALAGAEG